MLKVLPANNKKLAPKKEILWIHFCRILGSLAVIALHVSAYTTEAWAKWGLISVSIWAVPVFTMVSGTLLPKNFGRRLKRIVPPAIFWLPIFYVYFHQDRNIFSWNTLTNILVWGDVGHLYYFFILFGLAAAAPLLRNLIKKLTKVDLIKLIDCLFDRLF
jgi:surface polysaccharide O-acyltransferase-like enzyme